MKVFLSLGNTDLEEKIKKIELLEIVDSESDIGMLLNLLEFITVDYLIINRLLDDRGGKLIEIAKIAKSKKIKVILFIDSFEEQEEKLLITSLAKENVNAFIKLEKFDEDNLINLLENYPDEFDFNMFNKIKDVKVEHKDVNEKIKIIERPVEVQTIVEKIKEKEVIDNSVITVVSNARRGKCFLSWILSSCLAERGYNTTLINNDKGYSASSYFGIDENSEQVMNDLIVAKDGLKLFNNGFQKNLNLKIIADTKTSTCELQEDLFLELIDVSRVKSSITLIDCSSNINNNTVVAIKQSNVVLLVFDINPAHFNLNCLMMNELKKALNYEKTIVVINNVYECKSYRLTQKFIHELGEFRDIVSIKNCGASATDCMMSDNTPYSVNKDFADSIDMLLDSIKSRGKTTYSISKKTLDTIYSIFVKIGEFMRKYLILILIILGILMFLKKNGLVNF